MMKIINLKCKIITPLIISGADNKDVELREQSLKGILRWWFRFYKGRDLNIQDLKQIEGKIWGSQDLASRVKIIIREKQNLVNKMDAYLCMNDQRRKGPSGSPKDYSRIKRLAFSEEQTFTIEFNLCYPLDERINYEDQLEKTLFFFSNFGGLGARWRRGFGSIMRKDDVKTFESFEQVGEYLKNELRKIYSGNSFSQLPNNNFMHLGNTSIFLINHKERFWDKWENCMNDLRDKFYRNLKRNLGENKIAIGSPRAVSPLIIQIKKVGNGYYGVILVWKNWEKYKDFLNFIMKSVNNFEVIEINHHGHENR